MLLKKLRKIYRVLFPAQYSEKDMLENVLRLSKDVWQFEKKQDYYNVLLKDGILIRVRNHLHSDILVFQQIFNEGEYNLLPKMLQLNKDDSEYIIVDAGANVGYTTVFLNKKLNNSKFYLIEPEEENTQMILKNTEHIPKSRIKLYKSALAPEGGKLYTLKKDFRDGKDWSFTTDLDSSGHIKGISLNEIVDQNKLDYISFLKIDIEGSERFIFDEENDLSFLAITRILAIEIHEEYSSKSKIYQVLTDRGFFLFENGELSFGINKNL